MLFRSIRGLDETTPAPAAHPSSKAWCPFPSPHSSHCSRGTRQRQRSGKAGRATTAARQSHEGAGFEDSVLFYYKAAMAGRRHPAHCEALPAAPASSSRSLLSLQGAPCDKRTPRPQQSTLHARPRPRSAFSGSNSHTSPESTPATGFL